MKKGFIIVCLLNFFCLSGMNESTRYYLVFKGERILVSRNVIEQVPLFQDQLDFEAKNIEQGQARRFDVQKNELSFVLDLPQRLGLQTEEVRNFIRLLDGRLFVKDFKPRELVAVLGLADFFGVIGLVRQVADALRDGLTSEDFLNFAYGKGVIEDIHLRLPKVLQDSLRGVVRGVGRFFVEDVRKVTFTMTSETELADGRIIFGGRERTLVVFDPERRDDLHVVRLGGGKRTSRPEEVVLFCELPYGLCVAALSTGEIVCVKLDDLVEGVANPVFTSQYFMNKEVELRGIFSLSDRRCLVVTDREFVVFDFKSQSFTMDSYPLPKGVKFDAWCLLSGDNVALFDSRTLRLRFCSVKGRVNDEYYLSELLNSGSRMGFFVIRMQEHPRGSLLLALSDFRFIEIDPSDGRILKKAIGRPSMQNASVVRLFEQLTSARGLFLNNMLQIFNYVQLGETKKIVQASLDLYERARERGFDIGDLSSIVRMRRLANGKMLFYFEQGEILLLSGVDDFDDAFNSALNAELDELSLEQRAMVKALRMFGARSRLVEVPVSMSLVGRLFGDKRVDRISRDLDVALEQSSVPGLSFDKMSKSARVREIIHGLPKNVKKFLNEGMRIPMIEIFNVHCQLSEVEAVCRLNRLQEKIERVDELLKNVGLWVESFRSRKIPLLCFVELERRFERVAATVKDQKNKMKPAKKEREEVREKEKKQDDDKDKGGPSEAGDAMEWRSEIN